MSEIAIRVENLSKQYRIGGPSTLRRGSGQAGLRTGPQARYKTIRALWNRPPPQSLSWNMTYSTGRESLTEAVQAPFRRLSSIVRGQSSAVSNETIWALKDVSFEACPELSRRVRRGQVVGIIGRNAAGKTTLASTSPVQGSRSSPASPSRRRAMPRLRREPSRTVHGRVASLLEVEEWCCKNDTGERRRTYGRFKRENCGETRILTRV